MFNYELRTKCGQLTLNLRDKNCQKCNKSAMFYDTELASSDHPQWAKRSEFWRDKSGEFSPKRKVRERPDTPLIICGNGMSLRVENGALVIRDGFTHYPQSQTIYRLFAGDRGNPTRIVVIDGSGTLTFAVLSWLADQRIALIRLRWTGEVEIMAGGHGFSGDVAKIDWQRRTRADNSARLAFGSELISRKFAACLNTLAAFVPESTRREAAEQMHRESIEKLRRQQFSAVSDIRVMEGHCAAQYFNAWKGLSLRWIGKQPVPPQWQSYRSRSSLAGATVKPTNQGASHPLNAMLNYAYGLRLAKLQLQAIADGYDPTIGIFHRGEKRNAAYAFDLIEPERPKVDATILKFVADNEFAMSDFILTRDGVCRLSPQLARSVAALSAT